METMVRESWTDGRLDEFGKRIDERFNEVDKRFDKIEERLIAMQQEATDRTLSQNRVMIFAVLALSSAYMAGFAALVTQV